MKSIRESFEKAYAAYLKERFPDDEAARRWVRDNLDASLLNATLHFIGISKPWSDSITVEDGSIADEIIRDRLKPFAEEWLNGFLSSAPRMSKSDERKLAREYRSVYMSYLREGIREAARERADADMADFVREVVEVKP